MCNVSQRIVVCADGEVGHIDLFMDADGNQTDDAEEYAIAIVHWRESGGYSPVWLEDFEHKPFH